MRLRSRHVRRTLGLLAVAALGAVIPLLATGTLSLWTNTTRFTGGVTAGVWAPADTVVNPVTNATTPVGGTTWTINSTSPTSACFTTPLTGTSTPPTWAQWTLSVDLTKAPFNGMTYNGSNIFYQGTTQVTIAANGDNQHLSVTGMGSTSPPTTNNPWNAAYNNRFLDTAHTLSITLCTSQAVPPPPPTGTSTTPSNTYTVSIATGDPNIATNYPGHSPAFTYDPALSWANAMGNQSGPCEVVTITGTVTDLASNPFFFGWATTLDLSPAEAWIRKTAPYASNTGYTAKTVNNVNWTPYPSTDGYQFLTNPAPPFDHAQPSYALTSGQQTVIKGTQSTTIRACVAWY